MDNVIKLKTEIVTNLNLNMCSLGLAKTNVEIMDVVENLKQYLEAVLVLHKEEEKENG